MNVQHPLPPLYLYEDIIRFQCGNTGTYDVIPLGTLNLALDRVRFSLQRGYIPMCRVGRRGGSVGGDCGVRLVPDYCGFFADHIKSTHDGRLGAYASLVHNKTSLALSVPIGETVVPTLPANCSANRVAAYLKSPGMGEGSRDESGH
ncbi:hypothetical protein Pelo_16773 [Pelomyxa schiedti]|nr:hypothetical protein Pelo_16773 [Pelomyxa schiedti]